MLRRLIVATLAIGITGCAGPTVPPPSTDLADPASVLNAYLSALGSGDCAAGRTFAEPTFRRGNGDLCGAVRVSGNEVDLDTAPYADERVYATTQKTTGSEDG